MWKVLISLQARKVRPFQMWKIVTLGTLYTSHILHKLGPEIRRGMLANTCVQLELWLHHYIFNKNVACCKAALGTQRILLFLSRATAFTRTVHSIVKPIETLNTLQQRAQMGLPFTRVRLQKWLCNDTSASFHAVPNFEGRKGTWLNSS